jgi:hypothetical protein
MDWTVYVALRPDLSIEDVAEAHLLKGFQLIREQDPVAAYGIAKGRRVWVFTISAPRWPEASATAIQMVSNAFIGVDANAEIVAVTWRTI